MKLKYYFQGFIALILILGCSKDEPPAPEPKPVKVINEAPSTPIQMSPSHQEKCAPIDLLFTWQPSVDPEGDKVFYRIQVSTNENFSQLIYQMGIDENWVSLNFDPGITYYWRIKSIDNKDNESKYSPTRIFYTEPEPLFNNIPFQPEQVAPGNGVKVTANKVLLKWSAQDQDADELAYDLYLGTSNNPQLIFENLDTVSKEVSIEPNKTYYWKVVVKDQHGGKAIGAIWFFKT